MPQNCAEVTGRERLLIALHDNLLTCSASSTPASFQGADLAGLNLTKAKLRGMNLSGANLKGAVLDGADLTGTDLRGANLAEASLCSAHLISTDLRGAILSDANLTDANLYRARLTGAHLRRACLLGAGLNESQMEKVDLREANLRDCKLVRTQLQGARLDGANLQRAYLNEADLFSAMLISADLQQANLSGANLAGSNLRGADLQKSNLAGCFGVPADRTNTRLSASTYRKSGWQSPDIVEWLQAGSVLVDPERLPQLGQQLFDLQLGLILSFEVHIQSIDWFALYAIITVYREQFPGSNMRVVAFHEVEAATTIRILSDDPSTMSAFADVLVGRIWESEPLAGTAEEALIDALVMMSPQIQEQLSWLVDRIRRFELYVIEGSALQRSREWFVTVDRRSALARLLRVVFSPQERSQWLRERVSVPLEPLDTADELWSLQHFEEKGGSTAMLFHDLIQHSPAHAQDILLIARLWAAPVLAP